MYELTITITAGCTIFSAYSLGRLYWQSSQCEDNTSLREALTLYKYDSAGSRMFEELAAGSDRFYATLPLGSH